MKQWKDLKVGDTIYDSHGNPRIIAGETSRSWIIGTDSWSQVRYPKKQIPWNIWNSWYADEAEAKEVVWLWKHRYNIAHQVQGCEDPKVLRQIAELIGWKEPEKK